MSLNLTKHNHLDRTLVFAASVVLLGACSAPRPIETTGAAPLDQTVLGTAQSFAVLGGSTVTNTGAGLVIGRTIHAGDAVALQAQNDTTTTFIALGTIADHRASMNATIARLKSSGACHGAK